MHDEGVLPFGQILRRICDIGILVFTFTFSGTLEGSIIPQFMYTRVHCCEGGAGLPNEYDITDPLVVDALKLEANVLHLPLHIDSTGHVGACDVPRFPSSSLQWSMSSFCTNKAYVQESTQQTLGITAPLQKGVAFFILPIGAALSDVFGRRPVMGIYATCSVIGCAILVVDSHKTLLASGSPLLVIAGFVLLGLGGEPKDTIMVSCVADVLGHDRVNKSRAMYFLYACMMSAVLVSTTLNQFLSQHTLPSWEIPWMIFTVVAGLVLLQCITTLQETLPQELRTRFDWRKLNFVDSWQKSLAVVFGDWIILVSFCMEFLHVFSSSGMAGISLSYLVVAGFGPAEAMLVGIVAAASQVLGALGMVPLIVRLGDFPALSLSFVFQTAGHLVNGPLLLARPGVAYLGAVLVPVGITMYKPSILTILSQRVETSNQGKLMGGFFIADVLATLCSAPIFSIVLFKANRTGQRVALPAYVAMTATVLSFFMTLYVAYVVHRIPSAYDMNKDLNENEATRLESKDCGKPVSSGCYGGTDAAAA